MASNYLHGEKQPPGLGYVAEIVVVKLKNVYPLVNPFVFIVIVEKTIQTAPEECSSVPVGTSVPARMLSLESSNKVVLPYCLIRLHCFF